MEVPRKNVVYMNDNEFSQFLENCMEKGLTAEEIGDIIDSDCEKICPTTPQ